MTLSSRTTAQTSFTAAQGQVYSFRLVVKDTLGAQGVARANVSTRETPRVRILRFVASPIMISSGGSSTLNYLVDNATSVTITGVTSALNPQTGTVQVSPTQTTTYTLTARNAVSEDTAVTTIAVEVQPTRFVTCTASPTNITAGGSATLSWSSVNATTVEITGVGTFGATGTTTVMPAAPTTYTLIARGSGGEATCNASVQVGPPDPQARPGDRHLRSRSNQYRRGSIVHTDVAGHGSRHDHHQPGHRNRRCQRQQRGVPDTTTTTR